MAKTGSAQVWSAFSFLPTLRISLPFAVCLLQILTVTSQNLNAKKLNHDQGISTGEICIWTLLIKYYSYLFMQNF